MKFLEVPWLRTLLVYLLLVSAFLLYGRYSFYRDPGSMFYDDSRAFERRYSSYREHEVKGFMKELASSTSTNSTHAGPKPSVCASFLSVKREGEQYLPAIVP